MLKHCQIMMATPDKTSLAPVWPFKLHTLVEWETLKGTMTGVGWILALLPGFSPNPCHFLLPSFHLQMGGGLHQFSPL